MNPRDSGTPPGGADTSTLCPVTAAGLQPGLGALSIPWESELLSWGSGSGEPHPCTKKVLFQMEVRTGPFPVLADSLHQVYLDLENQGQGATGCLQLR